MSFLVFNFACNFVLSISCSRAIDRMEWGSVLQADPRELYATSVFEQFMASDILRPVTVLQVNSPKKASDDSFFCCRFVFFKVNLKLITTLLFSYYDENTFNIQPFTELEMCSEDMQVLIQNFVTEDHQEYFFNHLEELYCLKEMQTGKPKSEPKEGTSKGSRKRQRSKYTLFSNVLTYSKGPKPSEVQNTVSSSESSDSDSAAGSHRNLLH